MMKDGFVGRQSSEIQ